MTPDGIITPVTPEHVIQLTTPAIPNEVIEIFNALIIANWDYKQRNATIKQNILITNISQVLKLPKFEVHKQGYLNVISIYQKAGWNVCVFDAQNTYEESVMIFTIADKSR